MVLKTKNVDTPTATEIILYLINAEIIPGDHLEIAVQELDRELRRRTLRIAYNLARTASPAKLFEMQKNRYIN